MDNYFKTRYCSKIVRIARILGILVKKPCFLCNLTYIIHAHHFDYNLPLAVVWVCPFHHSQMHTFMRNLEHWYVDNLAFNVWR
jgi:hypothetical protein